VVKDLASSTLLDSYSIERVAAARENLSHGTKSTEFMAPPSFAFDLMRKAVLSLAVKHPQVRSLINPRQTSAISYLETRLNAASTQDSAFEAGPPPGAVLAECPVTLGASGESREGHVTDLLGPRFTLLHFCDGDVPAALLDLERKLAGDGVPLKSVALSRTVAPAGDAARGCDHTGRLFPMYDAVPGTSYLVRPDGHVLGRWKHTDVADVAAAIQHALRP
jgi:3-(3-hydroxy-phenyl)propionate hydroxylase